MLDIGLKDDIFISNELDAALQELDILFNTENTQLLGVPSYGVNFEQFLWSLTPATDSIEKYLKNKITTCTYHLAKLPYTIQAEYIYGDGECIYVIHFALQYKDKQYNKNFVVKHA